MVWLQLIAVHVKPVPLLPHKAAAFMQAHGTATLTKAGHKLDFGMIGIEHPVRTHFQPQPFCGRIEREVRGAGAGMPGGQQIVTATEHEGAVARAHQRFGVGGGNVLVQVRPAAGGKSQGLGFG